MSGHANQMNQKGVQKMEQIGNTLLLQDSIGGPPIRGTWELVKPEQARKWVEEMPRNRRGRVAHRKSLERKMDAGRYMERIADPIRFDWDGYLSDGENRLTAVVESGEVLYFLILRGYDPDDFQYMDEGVARTTADMLHVEGHPNTRDLSATIKAIWRMTHENKSIKPDNMQSKIFIGRHAGLGEAVKFGRRVYEELKIPPRLVASPFYMYALMGREDKYKKFWSEVGTANYASEERTPATILRAKLIAEVVEPMRTGYYRGVSAGARLMTWIYVAFEAYDRGDTIDSLELSDDEQASYMGELYQDMRTAIASVEAR